MGLDVNWKAFLTAKKKKKTDCETELRQMLKLKRDQIKKPHFMAVTTKNIRMSEQNCSTTNYLGIVSF